MVTIRLRKPSTMALNRK